LALSIVKATSDSRRKKLVEPKIRLDDKDYEEVFLTECNYSGILDDIIYAMHECYLNMPEISDPAHKIF
jgi:hypothetical protein